MNDRQEKGNLWINYFVAFPLLQGTFNVAESFYKRSLAIREQTRGRDHPEVTESLYWYNLWCLFKSQA